MFLSEGNKPDAFTFASLFSLCSNSEDGAFGIQMHCSLLKYGFMIASFLGSSLTNMYGNLEMVVDSYKRFHEIECKNEICYDATINSLVQNSNDETAITLFSETRKVGITPSQSTIIYIFGALGNLHLLRQGRALHSLILTSLGDSDSILYTENALVEIYAKCGAVDDAKMIFKEMIVQNGFSLTIISVVSINWGSLSKFSGFFMICSVWNLQS